MFGVQSFFEEPCFEPLPDDLEELFSDDLLQFLKSAEFAIDPAVAIPAPALAAGSEDGAWSSGCTSDSAASSDAAVFSAKPIHIATAAKPAHLPPAKSAGPRQSAAKAANRTSSGVPRTVTTELPPGSNARVKKEIDSPVVSSVPHSMDMDSDSDDEDSNDSAEDAMHNDSGNKVNKRKAPEVDWRSIEDPSERRRQRRLAKNRVTAARSRERKKVQWTDMELRLQNLEQDNLSLKAMLEKMTRENSSLRDQLASLSKGQGPASLRGNSTEPAVLVFIATLLLLCSILPSEQALALGGCVPLVLLAQLMRNPHSRACPLSDHLLRFIASLKVLLSKSAKSLQKGVDRILFGRSHYLSKATQRRMAEAGVYTLACMPCHGQYAVQRLLL